MSLQTLASTFSDSINISASSNGWPGGPMGVRRGVRRSCFHMVRSTETDPERVPSVEKLVSRDWDIDWGKIMTATWGGGDMGGSPLGAMEMNCLLWWEWAVSEGEGVFLVMANQSSCSDVDSGDRSMEAISWSEFRITISWEVGGK